MPGVVFRRAGFDLRMLDTERDAAAFRLGLIELIGIARLHLANALKYTLTIPRQETGIRRFCLWALGMAVLTLRKIHAHLDYTTGQRVKISRRSVKATVWVTSMAVGQDAVLRALFEYFTRPLPASEHAQRVVSV